jgi:hypothetical protein
MLGPRLGRPSRKDVEAVLAQIEASDLEDSTKAN